MINPTIETDLVGEMIEVYERHDHHPSLLARGRCRAVTSSAPGEIQLWLEILVAGDHCGYLSEVGDIVRVSSDTGQGDNIIRLVKTPT